MIYHSLFAAATLSFGLANAEQASSFDVPPEVAEQYGCGPDCQAALAQANVIDLAAFGPDFDFDFYATAGNFSASEPGDVLKLQPIDLSALALTDVPPGASAFKIQYTSQDLDGSSVPASGFVLLPGNANGPANLVAFAHGTAGGYRGCAPSNSQDLYRFQVWMTLLEEGYAVVATDYAGLGNNYTEHKYVSLAAHANDLVHSVTAVQKALPQDVSHNWVSVGHSQGGGAVWKLSEHALVQDAESGYLGGVAVAPAATKAYELVLVGLQQLQNSTDPADMVLLSLLPGVVGAIERVFPDYDPAWVADGMKQRLELADIGQYCAMGTGVLATGLQPQQILNSFDVTGDTYMAEFQRLNAPGQGDSASKPLLIVQGVSDPVVPVDSVKSSLRDTCEHGNPAHLSLYPGLDHDSILNGAAHEIFQFLADRFAEAPFEEGCSEAVRSPCKLN